MPTTLPNLGLIGRWADGEDGWGDEINDAIDILSIFVQCRVLSRVGALPGSPTDGDLHIFTGAGPEANQLVARINGAWEYFTPQEGYRVYDLNTEEYLSFIGSAWVADPTTLVSSFLDLSDITGDYTGRAGFSVVVNSTEDGLEFLNLGSGADDFLDLTDTPSSYSGQGGKSVRVNSGATALEFFDLPAAELPVLTGHARKALRVNSGATDVEWVEDITTSAVSASRDFTDDDFSGGRTLLVDSGSAVAMNIPAGLTRASPVLIVRQGTGAVSVTAAGGVTLNSADGLVAARVRYSSMSLIPVGTDSYILVGDLA